MSVSNSFPEDVIEAAKRIKLLALDVDGVLTDGSIYIDSNGNELKKVRDNHECGNIDSVEVCKNCSYKNSYNWEKI